MSSKGGRKAALLLWASGSTGRATLAPSPLWAGEWREERSDVGELGGAAPVERGQPARRACAMYPSAESATSAFSQSRNSRTFFGIRRPSGTMNQ